MINDLMKNFIEVTFERKDDFLLIKETLTRIGISSKKEKKLFQSCHILHKRGQYYIVHFKELFSLDGKKSTLTEEDIARRNTIARLLQEWGLCDIVGYSKTADGGEIFPPTMKEFVPLQKIKILSHAEKNEWELISKYNIGEKVK